MSDAKPSRPSRVVQQPSRMEINIPVARGEQIIRKADGSVVSRIEFTTGSVRENLLHRDDHPNAQTLEEIEASELKAKEPADVTEDKSPAPDTEASAQTKPKPKPTRARGVKGKGA